MAYFYRLILFNFFLFLGHQAVATTYYVKGAGDNSLSGTSIQNAWRTVGRINSSVFYPGDTILFEGGTTFKGNIGLGADDMGTPDSPIVISSYGTGKAIIFAGNSNGLYAYNTAGIEIRNLIFQGSGYTVNTGVGVYFYMDKTNNVKLKHVVIENTEVSDFNVSGIRIGSSPTDFSRSGYDSVIIRNCLIHDNGMNGINIFGYYKTTDSLYSHKHVLISRCKTYNNFGFSNLLEHSGSGMVISQVDTCLIEYCEAYENGKNNDYVLAGPAGLRVWDSKNVVIQYCYAHHNRSKSVDGDGFDLDGGMQNSMMQCNYAHDNSGPGFLITQHTGARKMKNVAVRYNIGEKNGKGLGALISNDDPGSVVTAEKIDFYNNTIYTDTSGNTLSNAALAVYNNYGTMKNIRVCNNIFLTRNNTALIDLQAALNLKFYNNFYFDHNNGFKIIDKGTTYNSLTIWRSVSGQEIYNGKNTGSKIDPDIINAGLGGSVNGVDSLFMLKAYRLKKSSLLIGNGVIIDSLLRFTEIVTDFFLDTVYTNNQYSPGAHEIDAPKAQFSITNNCLGIPTKVVNRCLKSISYLWKFGDGSTSSAFTPLHVYASPGIYTITLIATGKFGYVDSIKRNVEVYALPVPDFVVSNGRSCPNSVISFSSSGTGAVSYLWKFKDSATSTAASTTYSFSKSGMQDVKLIVTSGKNCKDSITKSIEIYPVPDPGFDVADPCIHDSARFISHGQNLLQYKWTFDSTLNSVDEHPVIYFNKTGAHWVKLVVISNEFCTDSLEQNIILLKKPLADFTAANTCIGDTLAISNLSSNDSLHQWQLGSSTSNQRIPRYTGSTAGPVNIILKVTAGNGCTDSMLRTAEIYSLPDPHFTSQRVSDSFSFKAANTTLKHYDWMIDQQLNTYHGPELHYHFGTKGKHSVLLKTFNTNDCQDTFSMRIDNSVHVSHVPLGSMPGVYPNPFADELIIHFDAAKGMISDLRITNLQGRIVCDFSAFVKDGQDRYVYHPAKQALAAGIYYLEINMNGHLITEKIIRE